MTAVRRLLRRIGAALRPHRADAGLDREIRSHLQLIEDENLRRGMSAEEARREARLALGGVEQIKELHRSERSIRWLDDTRRDVVYAVRTLRRRPVVAATATLSLALGIGLNAAVFSVVDWVLLRPLPYPAAHELVTLRSAGLSPATAPQSLTGAEFQAVARAATARKAGAFGVGTEIVSGAGVEPTHVQRARVTGDLFGTLGVAPALGRLFTTDEVMASAPVVVLSHDLWVTQLHRDANVVGRTLAVEAVPHLIVGVLAAHRGYPADVGFWRPTTVAERDDDRDLRVIVRVRPDATLDRANAELAAIAHAASNGSRTIWADPLQHADVRDVRVALTALIASTGLVLLIAVANVAALIGARSADRAGEMALRGALGASRARLFTQLLIESLVLAVAGGALGLIAGRWTLDLLIALAPAAIPRLPEIALDLRVVAAGLTVTLLVGVVAGVAPALRASRASAVDALHGVGWGRTPRPSAGRRALVVAQIALAVVLTIGAGLLARSLARQVHVSNGFDPDRLIAVRVELPETGPNAASLFPDLLELMRTTPGVDAGAIAMRLPTQPGGLGARVRDVLDSESATKQATLRPISPAYFDVIGTPLIAGRAFTETDGKNAPLVAIVNTSLARALFGGRAAIGARVVSQFSKEPVTIVGVVGDITPGGEGDRLAFYVPVEQLSIGSGHLVARVSASPAAIVQALRSRLRARSPELALDRIFRVAEALEDRRAATRFNTQLASTFAVLALLLSAIGIYGLAAADVAARWRELAVRMALGASRPGALWAVMRPCAIVAAIGAAVGAIAGLAAAPSLASLLPGVAASDPFTIAAAPMILAATGLIAAALASRRVLCANPAVALRGD